MSVNNLYILQLAACVSTSTTLLYFAIYVHYSPNVFPLTFLTSRAMPKKTASLRIPEIRCRRRAAKTGISLSLQAHVGVVP
jgi:uncharacterized lipoprotein